MKILVVEDDFVSRKMITMLLKRYGDIDNAIDGKEALKAFDMAHQEGMPYELIFLDIMMPELDGISVLKEIRKREEEMELFGTDGVKIFMTTALDNIETIKEAFREQCEVYMVKPIDMKKLEKEMERFLSNR